MLSGKKTYLTAAGGVLAAVGAYLSGEMEMGVMLNVVVTSLLAVFLRKGVKSDTGAAEADAES
jgi:hypothetical protein